MWCYCAGVLRCCGAVWAEVGARRWWRMGRESPKKSENPTMMWRTRSAIAYAGSAVTQFLRLPANPTSCNERVVYHAEIWLQRWPGRVGHQMHLRIRLHLEMSGCSKQNPQILNLTHRIRNTEKAKSAARRSDKPRPSQSPSEPGFHACCRCPMPLGLSGGKGFFRSV